MGGSNDAEECDLDTANCKPEDRGTMNAKKRKGVALSDALRIGFTHFAVSSLLTLETCKIIVISKIDLVRVSFLLKWHGGFIAQLSTASRPGP